MTGTVTDLPDGWGTSPYLLMAHGRSVVQASWQGDGALVVALEGHDGAAGLVGLGPAEAVAGLLETAVVETALVETAVAGAGWAGLRWATVPRGTWDAVGRSARVVFDHWSDPSAWDCMWTYRALVGGHAHPVERLDPGDAAVRAEVARTLGRAHPTASTSPDDPRLIGWWGARVDGGLVAVVGALRYAPGLAPHLVSLGVDPAHRGRGLAGAVLAAAVRDGLAAGTEVGPPAVWLGLYASNDVARRVYLRHGFELGHEFESRSAAV